MSTKNLARARERGRQRIRVVTRRVTAVAVAGCAVFAGLAAADGKSGAAKTASPRTTTAKKIVVKKQAAATTQATTTTTPAPTVTVTQTQSAPVTAAGGS